MTPLTMCHRHLPGVTVIEVRGEVDATNHERLREHVRSARALPADHVVFDLSAMTFMDSAGLHVLLACHQDALRHGARVHLAAPRGAPARLLEITGVDAHLPVFPTTEAAVAAATGPSR
ncbi:STAS domain-containing protein [Nonomuraea spiralis]|uniref:STAS domain-containing protein n=1 Tax=Nonomuraea TaxID=83681 RepID=UPI00163CFC04|nr:STAS domain-containing protein [Nonomuraea sp. WAC 01424]